MRYHGKYGLHGAFSIASALAVTGLLIMLNLAAVVLSALSKRW